MALGIVKIYLGSHFSANQRCLQAVCSRQLVRGQLLWTQLLVPNTIIFGGVWSTGPISNMKKLLQQLFLFALGFAL